VLKVKEEAKNEPKMVFEIALANTISDIGAMMVVLKYACFTCRTMDSSWRLKDVAISTVPEFDNAHR
jgi:hypothetical protein